MDDELKKILLSIRDHLTATMLTLEMIEAKFEVMETNSDGKDESRKTDEVR